jgi:hypothetical protein
MRESTVQVERLRAFDAAPDRVWSLLGSPAAWSLRPGRFAFDVPEPPSGTGRLRCVLGTVGEVTSCEVLEAGDEKPGQAVCWQRRDRLPAGSRAYTLSVRPTLRGTTACIAVRDMVTRGSRADWKTQWEAELGIWLDAMQATVEGQRPWPGAEMPEDVRQACSAGPAPAVAAYDSVSAEALISAPLGVVWEAVWSPETSRSLNPALVAYAGRVPGTPPQQAGEMQYCICRHADGRLTADVHVVSEFAYQQSALTQRVGPPRTQVLHLFAPEAGGTRLTLTLRWPAGTLREDSQDVRRSLTELMQTNANGYQVIIEASARAAPAR